MSTAKLIVVEPSPCWSIGLRRFAGDLRIWEARSLALAETMLQESPASFVCLSLDPANAVRGCEQLIAWSKMFPLSRFAVCTTPELAELESLLLTSGAQFVAASFLDVPKLLRIAVRHLATAPQAELSFIEELAARMPWRAVRTS